MRDRGDGTYGLAFTPVAAGPSVLSVVVMDDDVGGSPFEVDVVPGA